MARKPGSRARDYSLEPSSNRFGPKPVNPHSPWQLLVEKQREVTGQALRSLATRAQIPAGTLFNWVRAKTGAPPRTAYTANLNRRLAKALEIPAKDLADAYNASAFRPVDPDAIEAAPRPAPPSKETSAALLDEFSARLLATVKASGRPSITIPELESVIHLLAGTPPTSPPVKPLDPDAPE